MTASDLNLQHHCDALSDAISEADVSTRKAQQVVLNRMLLLMRQAMFDSEQGPLEDTFSAAESLFLDAYNKNVAAERAEATPNPVSMLTCPTCLTSYKPVDGLPFCADCRSKT